MTGLYTDAFAPAVATLGHTLNRANSSASRLLFYLPDKISARALCIAKASGWEPVQIERIAPPFRGVHRHFLDQYSKLQLWTLDQRNFRAVVYLDADTLVRSITQIGHRVEDVVAVLVTHGHVDHVGGLTRFLRARPVPVYAHALELDLLTGRTHEQASAVDLAVRLWRPRFRRWTLDAVRAGAAEHPVVDHPTALPASGALDVPGRPVPVLCAGHTTGHTAYHLPDRGVLLTGDALVTGHPLSVRTGPQMLPGFFANDPEEAVGSLSVLADLAADTLLPGHGTAWRGDPREAVDRARGTAPRVRR